MNVVSPSYLGGWGRRISWVYKFETSLGNIERPHLQTNKQIHRKFSDYKKAAVLCLSHHLPYSLTNRVQFPWLKGADLPATKLETRSWAKTPSLSPISTKWPILSQIHHYRPLISPTEPLLQNSPNTSYTYLCTFLFCPMSSNPISANPITSF